ncbi:MAG: NYN domain-containing protein, partial [bacterium]|nr:NYN domain-containing protein [bacterium]
TVQGNTNLLGNSTTTSATTTNAFVTSLLSTSATSSSLFSTTASSTNLYTSLFTLAGNTLTLTSNTTMGGTNTGDVTLDGTPDYLTISGQTITRNKLDISDDTNATGGLGLTLTANDFACDTADTGTFGCLTSTDWNTFNTKLGSYDAWTHPAYGGSATTSLLTLSGGFLNTAASSTIVGNLLITGNSTTTNATTTNSFATTASSTNFFSQLGTIGSLTLGTPLAVTSGGTGQLSFGQGWLHSDGATLTSSTSPTVAYLTATSTTATSTFAGGFFVGTSSPNFMVDAFTGRVGIGTTSPMATLAIQNGSLSLPNGTSVLPSLRFNDNYKMGFYMVQGTYPTIGVAANNGGDTAVAAFGRFGWGLTVAKSSSIGWTSSDNAVTGTIDVNLNRDAAYTLALKGGTAAQTFNIYATTTDTSNYERLSIAATNNLYTFGSQVAGYGTARNFNFTGGNVGIGTTTPTWLLNPTSATASQLALSAGAGFSQWAFRNAGGNLYFATTTVAGTATSSLSALTIDSNGNVGVATTSPVAGFAVATHCVTGDTKLRRRKRRKSHSAHTSLKLRVASKASRDDFIYDEVRIDEIKEGDEIQSLDEKTGKLVWSRVNKLMYMGEKEIWKITTESGKTIRTTSEHPYLVKTSTEEFPVKPKLGVFIDGGNMYHTSNRSGWRIDFAKLKNLLSQSADLVFINYHVIVPRKNDENYQSSISHIKIASKIFIIKEKLMKYIWDERVGKEIKKGDVDVDLAIDVVNSISELDVAIVISGDSDYLALENYTSQYGKPIIFMGYKHNMAWELRLKNHIFLELLRKFIEYGVKTNSDLSAGATLTSSIIHKAITESTVAVDKKDIKGGVWTKAKAVKEGQYIAIKGENDEAKYDKIVKIERLPEEQVYDIEVKGTHNFIGNDIIAHNTYLGGNLTVQGNTNLLGNSTTTSATTTNAFVTSLLSTSATSSSLFSTTASST